MAEVSGTISGSNGVEDVILNNAATESTLKMLLASTLAANKQTVDQLKELANKAGLSSDSFDKTNQQVGLLGATSSLANQSITLLSGVATQLRTSLGALGGISEKLTSGTGSLSAIADEISRLNPIIGTFTFGLKAIASFQEDAMRSYRGLTSVGSDFSGSLTNLRISASQTYLTMDEFTGVIKSNGLALSKMGEGVTDGTRNFVALSNSLLAGEFGSKLMALGYSTEDINNGLLSFINNTGGLSRDQLKNTTDITNATGQYLEELDRVTQVTGMNRKEIEEQQKAASLNAAYQRALSTMSIQERAKAEAGLSYAIATKTKGAVEAYMAETAKLPAGITKAGREFTGYASEAYQNGIRPMVAAQRDSSKSMADITAGAKGMVQGFISSQEKLNGAGDAIAFTGGETVNSISLFATQMRNNGDAFDEVIKNQASQYKSQASNAGDTQRALQKLGTSILEDILPVLKPLMYVVNAVTQGFAWVATEIAKIPSLFYTLAGAVGVVITGLTAFSAAVAYQKIALAIGDIKKGGIADYVRNIGVQRVFVTNWPATGVGLGGASGVGGGGAIGGGRTKETPRQSGGRIQEFASRNPVTTGIVAASVIGTVATSLAAISDIAEINERRNRGELTSKEASEAKGEKAGGALGSIIGEIAGGALVSVLATAGIIASDGLLAPILLPLLGGAGAFAGKSIGETVGKSLASESSTSSTPAPESDKPEWFRNFESHSAAQTYVLNNIHNTLEESNEYHRSSADDIYGVYRNTDGFTWYSLGQGKR